MPYQYLGAERPSFYKGTSDAHFNNWSSTLSKQSKFVSASHSISHQGLFQLEGISLLFFVKKWCLRPRNTKVSTVAPLFSSALYPYSSFRGPAQLRKNLQPRRRGARTGQRRILDELVAERTGETWVVRYIRPEIPVVKDGSWNCTDEGDRWGLVGGVGITGRRSCPTQRV